MFVLLSSALDKKRARTNGKAMTNMKLIKGLEGKRKENETYYLLATVGQKVTTEIQIWGENWLFNFHTLS